MTLSFKVLCLPEVPPAVTANVCVFCQRNVCVCFLGL